MSCYPLIACLQVGEVDPKSVHLHLTATNEQLRAQLAEQEAGFDEGMTKAIATFKAQLGEQHQRYLNDLVHQAGTFKIRVRAMVSQSGFIANGRGPRSCPWPDGSLTD